MVGMERRRGLWDADRTPGAGIPWASLRKRPPPGRRPPSWGFVSTAFCFGDDDDGEVGAGVTDCPRDGIRRAWLSAGFEGSSWVAGMCLKARVWLLPRGGSGDIMSKSPVTWRNDDHGRELERGGWRTRRRWTFVSCGRCRVDQHKEEWRWTVVRRTALARQQG